MANNTLFVLWARNAEALLPRAIDSLLAQTCQSWRLCLIDNDSTDGTYDVMLDYAAKDSRISPVKNGENDMQLILKYLPGWLEAYDDDDYLAVLDADDAYSPRFLEDMLDFTRENRLDVSCCGSNIISAVNPDDVKYRLLTENLIVEGDGFSAHFPVYYDYLRPFWAKLFSFGTLRRMSSNFPPGLIFGLDTFFVVDAVLPAARLGILAEALHDYYVYPKSVTTHIDHMRIEADRILYRKGGSYLRDKCGGISKENRAYLREIYFQSAREALRPILRSNKRLLADLFRSPRFDAIFLQKGAKKILQRLFSSTSAPRNN